MIFQVKDGPVAQVWPKSQNISCCRAVLQDGIGHHGWIILAKWLHQVIQCSVQSDLHAKHYFESSC